jgi:hypothetical protein
MALKDFMEVNISPRRQSRPYGSESVVVVVHCESAPSGPAALPTHSYLHERHA